MKYFLFLILLIISCTPTEPEAGSILGTEDEILVSECGGPYGYDCRDISALRTFIEINSTQEIFRHYMDYNNNGNIEAKEFGYQVWDDGRLIGLDLNYPKDIIMTQDNPSELDLANYRLKFIPDNIDDLDQLESLFLHDNEFTSIPESFGNLTKLKILDLENNLITALPSSYGNLVNLERLVLSYNLITSLPESIGSLTSLKKLWLRYNQLASLPESLGNLIQLVWLYLNNNLLEELPDEIGNLVNLQFLNIENNLISSLPVSMCDEMNGNLFVYELLETFSVDNNQFCDDDEDGIIDLVPSCLDLEYEKQSCSQCQPWEFNIEGYCADSTDYNILQNFLDLNPSAIEEGLIQMYAYDGASNPHWWNEGRLIEITFYAKALTSEIPENFGLLDKLEILNLNQNQLTGEIPASIMNLANLKELILSKNHLIGDIPENIGSLSNLEDLDLKNNQLGCYEYNYECDSDGKNTNCCITRCADTVECNGEIPQNITNLSNLKYLYLNNNYFLRGGIPENIGNLSSLEVLRLDKNQLVEEIPESIGYLNNMKRLYLQNNDLSGKIPLSLCNLGLTKFYYQGNSFCPPYPESDCASVTYGESMQECE